MTEINVNRQSSIRIAGSLVLRFDPWEAEGQGDADLIFITHSHYDHFSPPDVQRLLKADGLAVAPAAMERELLARTELDREQCLFVQPGERRSVRGISFSAVPAYNIGKPFHPRENGWCGYAVTMDEERFYITGDTDLIPEMADIRCDTLLIPVGGTYTVDKNEAVRCAQLLRPRTVIPTHYGSVTGTPQDGSDFCRLMAAAAPEIKVVLKLNP